MCKLHREGLPERQDMTEGAVLSSLGERGEKGMHGIIIYYRISSIKCHPQIVAAASIRGGAHECMY